MTESDNPPRPPGDPDEYDTAPPSAPPPPPDAAMLNPNPTPPAAAPVEYGAGGYLGGYSGPAPDPNAKTWGMVSHLSALVQLLAIPAIVGPLVVWLLKKNEHPFIDDQGKESLNFQITVLIAGLVISPTICLFGIGIVLLILLYLAALILSVIAGVKANEGIAYRYPWTLRLVK